MLGTSRQIPPPQTASLGAQVWLNVSDVAFTHPGRPRLSVRQTSHAQPGESALLHGLDVELVAFSVMLVIMQSRCNVQVPTGFASTTIAPAIMSALMQDNMEGIVKSEKK